ncbi:MAG: ABC transporter permease [Acidimicrobiia bacterium]|nr:ABC transporter permease [Acidimicrobiia bacterium]
MVGRAGRAPRRPAGRPPAPRGRVPPAHRRGAGGAVRAYLAQARVEVVLSLRQGEQLLVAIGIPLLVLVFFSTVDVLPTGSEEPIEVLAPAVLALALMSTAMVSLGIATGFERHYGVLERLGLTPLGRARLLAAKLTMVLLVELAQVVVLIAVAAALGWSPDLEPLAFLAAVLLGTAAFAGLGMLLAGTLSGPANLAATNGLYLVLLLFGGIAVPADELPAAARDVARLLPSGALAEVLGAAAGNLDWPGPGAWLVLAAWACVLPLLAGLLFRWNPR